MATWASRRKFTYAFVVVTTVILVVVVPIFYLFYKAPTCSDGKLNGDETGLDCGGSCSRLCQSYFLPPRIDWGGAKLEKVADGQYNIAAYIVNPNITGAAIGVPYKISLYGDDGVLITERIGKIDLYAHRNSLAFETAIHTDNSIPRVAIFEFLEAPVWFKSSDLLSGISIVDKQYTEDNDSSSLIVTLENKTLTQYEDITVSVVLKDIDGNAIGFSQTKLDSLVAKGKEIAPFTWPIGRNNRVVTQDVLLMIRPAIAQ